MKTERRVSVERTAWISTTRILVLNRVEVFGSRRDAPWNVEDTLKSSPRSPVLYLPILPRPCLSIPSWTSNDRFAPPVAALKHPRRGPVRAAAWPPVYVHQICLECSFAPVFCSLFVSLFVCVARSEALPYTDHLHLAHICDH